MDVIRGFAQHHLKERKKKGQKIKGFEKKECNRISMCTRSIIQFPTSTTTAESLLLGNGGEGNKQPDNMQAKEEIKDILYPFLKKRERDRMGVCAPERFLKTSRIED
jgi:hypothetical protein